MHALKRAIKKARWIHRFMKFISWPVVWLLLHVEQLSRFLSDWTVRRAIFFFRDGSSGSKYMYRLVCKHFMSHRLTAQMAKKVTEYGLTMPASLASALFLRDAYGDRKTLPEWKINEKLAGRRFAEALGLNIPKLLFENMTIQQLPVLSHGIIKPVEGWHATGVFVISSPEYILELKTGQVFHSWEGLKGRMQQLFAAGNVPRDLWMGEEYICHADGSPAHDIKFNVFYGKTGWVVEIKRYPRMLFHLMDGQGEGFQSELYTKDEVFIGDGVTSEELELAKRISLEIPVPFIRIDFVRNEDGLYFIEFTPQPGVIGHFNRKRDQLYGQWYHEAEARLAKDFLDGKKFSLLREM